MVLWQKGGRRFSVETAYGADHHTDRVVVIKKKQKSWCRNYS